ncbi:MAG TPA: hypothetical protein VG797_03915 [Phycisphaerales bacterium]|nr:hypothetical protein [Phycisphaerales bacterium]
MIVPGAKGIRVVRSAGAAALGVARGVASAGFVGGALERRGGRVLKVDARTAVMEGVLLPEHDGRADKRGARVDGQEKREALTPALSQREREQDNRSEEGRRVVVKTMLVNKPKHLFQRLFGSTRLMRQWDGAELLMTEGFECARPVVLFRGRDERGRLVETLVLDHLEGRTLLEYMAARELSVEQEHVLADAVALVVRRLAEKRLVNGDAKPSNWVVRWGRGGDGGATEVARLAFIDTVAVGRDLQSTGVIDHLADLVIEAIGVGCLPRRSLLWRVVKGVAGEGAKKVWREVAARVERHGDATPRVDPLRR